MQGGIPHEACYLYPVRRYHRDRRDQGKRCLQVLLYPVYHRTGHQQLHHQDLAPRDRKRHQDRLRTGEGRGGRLFPPCPHPFGDRGIRGRLRRPQKGRQAFPAKGRVLVLPCPGRK